MLNTESFSVLENTKVTPAKEIPSVREIEEADVELQKVVDWYSEFTQFITWPVIFLVSKIFFKINIKGRYNFKNVKGPFIIIANHITHYDSFLFRIALGLWTRHLPLRFMAVDRFQWNFLNILAKLGIIKAVYMLFGVFTVVPGRGIEENLKTPINIIKSGGSVVIYPEGKVVMDGKIGEFKNGAAALHRRTGAMVIPVLFRFSAKSSGFRRELSIVIGGPLSILDGFSDPEITESFRRSLLLLDEQVQ